jgi:putative colanic acid biosynthesis acetyltransferase WcaF
VKYKDIYVILCSLRDYGTAFATIQEVKLASFKKQDIRQASLVKLVLWMLVSALLFRHSLAVFSGLKCFILRLFGAKLGKAVLIKPSVNIKFPWKLQIGNDVWVGEGVWIDNLSEVIIENDVCISQGAYLLTGNHNYKLDTFDLITEPITIKQGTWIGAKAIVCPGVTCGENSVLSVYSVATENLEPNAVYQGNPAKNIRTRS